jgi:hypothetical protein
MRAVGAVESRWRYPQSRPHRDRQYSGVLFAGHNLGTELWLILFFDSLRV